VSPALCELPPSDMETAASGEGAAQSADVAPQCLGADASGVAENSGEQADASKAASDCSFVTASQLEKPSAASEADVAGPSAGMEELEQDAVLCCKGFSLLIAGLTFCCCLFIGACILLIMLYFVKSKVSPGPPADCHNIPSLAGHPAIAVHNFVTKDGMTLAMWRVPGDVSKPRRPVLIMHGFECSSRDWFAGLDADSLPWLMWRSGFDVWVGNSRGNYLSTTPNWAWTQLQMGDIDLPTMVDAILADTGAKSLVYIGHSLGGLNGFMHFSENATTAKRISHFVGLAPAVYLTQQRYTWNVLAKFHVDDIVSLATAKPGTSFAVYEEMQRDKCYAQSFVGACWDCALDMGGSYQAGDKGFASECHEKFRCIPAGTSSDTLRAFADALRAGGFQQYLRTIGREINFTKLTIPIAVAAGEKDLFMTPADVKKTQTACTRSSDISKFWELGNGGHMDLVWGKEAPAVVYRPMLKWLGATETPVVVVGAAPLHVLFFPALCAMSLLHGLM